MSVKIQRLITRHEFIVAASLLMILEWKKSLRKGFSQSPPNVNSPENRNNWNEKTKTKKLTYNGTILPKTYYFSLFLIKPQKKKQLKTYFTIPWQWIEGFN